MTGPPPTRPPGPAPEHFPLPWACDWGEDRHGPWQALTYRGARQAFRWIPPTPEPFLMGSPPDEPERFYDEPQHEVLLTRGFWLAETACTQALWRAVTGDNPSRFRGDDRPVETVSWDDCQTFIGRLNTVLDAAIERHDRRRGPAETALPAVIGTRPAGAADPPRLRLPTEAEWEYACRAGTSGPFSFGDDLTPELANFDGTPRHNGTRLHDGTIFHGSVQESQYRQEPVPVTTLPPNPWGLYEMHGNVWEWCMDWYGYYPDGSVRDPVGPATGEGRVVRGGSWFRDERYLRSAYRIASVPGNRDDGTGLRLALGAELRQMAAERPQPHRPGSEQ